MRYLASTIPEGNTASWALFESVARTMGAETRRYELFSRDVHFDGAHDSEIALTIGPFGQDRVASLKG